MKIDQNFLKNIIEESLKELQEDIAMGPETTDQMQDEQAQKNLDQLQLQLDSLKKQLALVRQENEALKSELKQKEQMNTGQPESQATPVPTTLPESFQIKKGRLREIIAEEMKKAKDQGLL